IKIGRPDLLPLAFRASGFIAACAQRPDVKDFGAGHKTVLPRDPRHTETLAAFRNFGKIQFVLNLNYHHCFTRLYSTSSCCRQARASAQEKPCVWYGKPL